MRRRTIQKPRCGLFSDGNVAETSISVLSEKATPFERVRLRQEAEFGSRGPRLASDRAVSVSSISMLPKGAKRGRNATLVSSGIASLDACLGGGIALGSLLLLLEDVRDTHAPEQQDRVGQRQVVEEVDDRQLRVR